MLFDTDVIIDIQKGVDSAAQLINKSIERYISIFSYMELMQCAENNLILCSSNKKHFKIIKELQFKQYKQ